MVGNICLWSYSQLHAVNNNDYFISEIDDEDQQNLDRYQNYPTYEEVRRWYQVQQLFL
jgi:hypothetical protein